MNTLEMAMASCSPPQGPLLHPLGVSLRCLLGQADERGHLWVVGGHVISHPVLFVCSAVHSSRRACRGACDSAASSIDTVLHPMNDSRIHTLLSRRSRDSYMYDTIRELDHGLGALPDGSEVGHCFFSPFNFLELGCRLGASKILSSLLQFGQTLDSVSKINMHTCILIYTYINKYNFSPHR